MRKKLFSEFMKDLEHDREQATAQNIQGLQLALEHRTYKQIPKTQNSYRQDKGNTNTGTQDHLHVYAKREGGGEELYSVNMNGSGHDGSSGKVIPAKHADHFRSLGYDIKLTNALESIDFDAMDKAEFSFVILDERDSSDGELLLG